MGCGERPPIPDIKIAEMRTGNRWGSELSVELRPGNLVRFERVVGNGVYESIVGLVVGVRGTKWSDSHLMCVLLVDGRVEELPVRVKGMRSEGVVVEVLG